MSGMISRGRMTQSASCSFWRSLLVSSFSSMQALRSWSRVAMPPAFMNFLVIREWGNISLAWSRPNDLPNLESDMSIILMVSWKTNWIALYSRCMTGSGLKLLHGIFFFMISLTGLPIPLQRSTASVEPTKFVIFLRTQHAEFIFSSLSPKSMRFSQFFSHSITWAFGLLVGVNFSVEKWAVPQTIVVPFSTNWTLER